MWSVKKNEYNHGGLLIYLVRSSEWKGKEAVDDSDPHDFTFDLSDPTFHNLLAKKT